MVRGTSISSMFAALPFPPPGVFRLLASLSTVGEMGDRASERISVVSVGCSSWRESDHKFIDEDHHGPLGSLEGAFGVHEFDLDREAPLVSIGVMGGWPCPLWNGHARRRGRANGQRMVGRLTLKRLISSGRSFFISIHAICWPIQILLPPPKYSVARSILANATSSASSHRSGR